jgi:hypothetical protein
MYVENAKKKQFWSMPSSTLARAKIPRVSDVPVCIPTHHHVASTNNNNCCCCCFLGTVRRQAVDVSPIRRVNQGSASVM